MGNMRFITSCVNSTAETISPMVDADEKGLGYEQHPRQGLTMAGDWHVSYHRSVFCGQPCYFFRWSAIEHVFIEGRPL